MALGMQVGLSPRNFVLDRDPAPSLNGGRATNFRNTFIVAKRLDASRCHLVRSRSRPRQLVLDRDPAPQKKGTAPNFRPMSIVTKLLYVLGYHLVWR